MTPDEYCQDKTARSGSSFYYSFLFLPADRRRAITALYAFCREVDDVVDECREPDVAQRKLDWWRAEIAALFAGQPSHPVTQALSVAISQFNLPEEHFQEIIDGMAMDLSSSRYATFQELSLYCYRVAGVVGLMAAEIFGYQQRNTQKYAHHLGMAFQLTNIIRDIREDARRSRIYLPLEDLARFGVSEADILNGKTSAATQQLMAFQLGRAREYYQKAFDFLPEEDRYPQRIGLIMSAIYLKILARIEQNPNQVFASRVSLSPLHKLWLAWRTARTETRRQRRRHAR